MGLQAAIRWPCHDTLPGPSVMCVCFWCLLSLSQSAHNLTSPWSEGSECHIVLNFIFRAFSAWLYFIPLLPVAATVSHFLHLGISSFGRFLRLLLSPPFSTGVFLAGVPGGCSRHISTLTMLPPCLYCQSLFFHAHFQSNLPGHWNLSPLFKVATAILFFYPNQSFSFSAMYPGYHPIFFFSFLFFIPPRSFSTYETYFFQPQ